MSMVLLLVAFGSFTAANLIHNNFGLDLAIVPSAVLTALHWWRPRRGFLLGGAIFIALPAFLFLKWSSLTDHRNVLPFLNHIALLTAGVLALTCMVESLLARSGGRRAAAREQ